MPIRRRDIALINAIHNAITLQIGLFLDLLVNRSSGIIYYQVI